MAKSYGWIDLGYLQLSVCRDLESALMFFFFVLNERSLELFYALFLPTFGTCRKIEFFVARLWETSAAYKQNSRSFFADPKLPFSFIYNKVFILPFFFKII